MIKHKYKVYDRIINTDGQIGVVTGIGTSRVDNDEFASYWVQYDESVHPDGHSRNTWETSIMGIMKK